MKKTGKIEFELLKISRRLTPEHQSELRNLVLVAYRAENSVRKSLADGASILKPQEYSCANKVLRSKK